ncbi:MAG: hypothetical protein M3P33_01035, partial [bacterium]|nr:hypothetical protein [bacterium]
MIKKITKIKNILPNILTILIIVWVFSNWIYSPVNLGGDFNFTNFDHFRLYSLHPYIWDLNLNNGFGQYTIFTLPFFFYAFTIGKFAFLNLSPFLLHKLIYLLPLLVISYFSINYSVSIFIKHPWARAFAIIFYLTNPYYIMLSSGGQIGVSFAYAFSPFLIANTYQILTSKTRNNTEQLLSYIFFGFYLSILISFDSRIALLTLLSIIILILAKIIFSKDISGQIITSTIWFSVSLIVVFGFHAYWLIPSIFVYNVSLPIGYDAISSLFSLSFSRFAHAISLSHPNYPDNQFGVVKEINLLSLSIPIFAFYTLKKSRKIILYFSFIAILSIFFAKGVNPPFSQIYQTFFSHIPLFNWYRDSTKFYLLICIAYTILLGITFESLINYYQQYRKKLTFSIIVFFLSTLLYLWWPTFSRQINGTLAYSNYPDSYRELENILNNDRSYGRVLWIPNHDRYTFSTPNHPQVILTDLIHSPSCLSSLCSKRYQPIKKDYFSKTDLYNQIDQEMKVFQDPHTQTIFQD